MTLIKAIQQRTKLYAEGDKLLKQFKGHELTSFGGVEILLYKGKKYITGVLV